jgi:hypothetical protein
VGAVVGAGIGAVEEVVPTVIAVGRNGVGMPIPKGAQGPIPNINPAGVQTGVQFNGFSAGKNGQVNAFRMMDPTTPQGANPWYPNDYGVYMNAAGQTVNPFTGRTIPNSDPYAHLPFGF